MPTLYYLNLFDEKMDARYDDAVSYTHLKSTDLCSYRWNFIRKLPEQLVMQE